MSQHRSDSVKFLNSIVVDARLGRRRSLPQLEDTVFRSRKDSLLGERQRSHVRWVTGTASNLDVQKGKMW